MINLPLFYKNKSEEDKKLIVEVCESILSQPLKEQEYSNEFAFLFVDGRPNMDFNTLEHHTMFHSCRAFSEKRYPIYCLVNNIDGLFYNKELTKYDLTVIKIQELNNLEEYSRFMIEKVFFMLPENIENIITIQSDGFLLKSGWEDYIINSKCDWLSSHWKHYAGIDLYQDFLKISEWKIIPHQVCIGNGGFSFRKISQLKEVSKTFSKILDKTRERGRSDNRIPMEDLFYCFFMKMFSNFNMPTLRQCDEFSKDPLTRKDWHNKTHGMGFHYFKCVSEFPECNHE